MSADESAPMIPVSAGVALTLDAWAALTRFAWCGLDHGSRGPVARLEDLVNCEDCADEMARLEEVVARLIAEAEERGAARGWDESAQFLIRKAEVTSPEVALEQADRFNRFNPYRTPAGGSAPSPSEAGCERRPDPPAGAALGGDA